MNEVERFLKSIDFNKYPEAFAKSSIEKVILNKKTENFQVYFHMPEPLTYEISKELFEHAKKGIHNQLSCSIYISYDSYNDDNVLEYVSGIKQDLLFEKPSLMGLKETLITLEGKRITFEVTSSYEQMEIGRESTKILKQLEAYGFFDYQITTFLNTELKEEIKKEIESSKTTEVPKEEIKRKDGEPIVGRKIEGEPNVINNIMGDVKNVILEVFVFDKETMERETINILTLKISDKTNSILAKIFKKQKDEFKRIDKDIKVGKWYRVQGNVEFDNFAKDLVLAIRNMEEIPSKDEVVKDESEEKRVELHAHTMMSAMDGVIGGKDLVNYAMKLGHKAVAVTDHNCVQSFPEMYHTVRDYNKGKEASDRFKVLYGAEMNIVNDDVDVIFNPKEYNLLQDTFVVFDTETTGFYAGHDQMIEIGAVKIQNGEILDRFDELIDPHRPIPTKITELTFITDEMVQGKDDEETVTKRFLEWAKDLPMVAHNAKFDISFMKAAMNKYNLGEFTNTVVDTMSLARILNPEWANHKLQTLTKKYGIEWDEEKHHRADYDAEGTSIAFYKMCKILFDRNIETTMHLYESIDVESLVRFSYPFHACLLAQNREGLKNLFKIVSIANTKYLYKNEQPKILRKEIQNLRKGLLIGSGCINGEIFEAALTKEDEELVNMMSFYDYIEVQPISACMHLVGENRTFASTIELENHLKKIIRVAKEAGKPVCATSDAHHLKKEDKIYREIIVNQRFNGRLHPLNRKGLTVPDMHFLTTEEMMEEFSFLSEEERKEIVITNPNKIADAIEEIEVIIETHGIPFAPIIENSQMIVTDMVYEKAKEWYGDPLPFHIEERIALELYGAPFIEAVKKNAGEEESEIYKRLHDVVTKGPEAVQKEICLSLQKEEPEESEEELMKKAKGKMTAIIGANFDVIYLIAQKLVKHSNDEGFLVGSRGSVGSSFVANLMGITEVNSLAPHYRCPKCQRSEFDNENGEPLGNEYKCGYDLPDRKCPNCKVKMVKEGQDIPFQTFLGFNADKVPDIDLNFSDLNQASAHEYTKVLFGVDNVYRAGTIGTVAEKTAYGYVRGYCEDKSIIMRNVEIERLAKGCTGVKRTTGQHPGGIVVIPGYMEVFDFTPFQFPAEDPNSAWRTTHFDYHAIDECVLKLDILGHTDPTQLRMIQDITGEDVRNVPLDDKETMSIFTSTKALGVTPEQIMCETGTLGVPEFGTPFTIQLVKDTKPKTFAELIKISGLSHGTDVWLGNAQELIQKNIVPFSKVIGCRDDIMVELMYGGLEPFKAFKIMEFVRKGKASKDAETWAGFVEIMENAKIPDWFIKSCFKIKYMFPKAHAAAYVMSAFRIAWFKVHKPAIYYATYFSTRFEDFDIEVMMKGYDAIRAKIVEIQSKGYDATNKEQAVLETLKLSLEATARGFKFGCLDINKSDSVNFLIDEEDDHVLIPPFRTLDGLGDAVAKKIIEERNQKAFYSVEDFQNRGKVNATTVEKLRALGLFEGMPETSQLSLF